MPYQICSLIFFPCNSTVLILKSIPERKQKASGLISDVTKVKHKERRGQESGERMALCFHWRQWHYLLLIVLPQALRL